MKYLGYRDHLTLKECLGSLVYCHNEIGNIYTHLTASVLFIGLLARDILRDDLSVHHRAVVVIISYQKGGKIMFLDVHCRSFMMLRRSHAWYLQGYSTFSDPLASECTKTL